MNEAAMKERLFELRDVLAKSALSETTEAKPSEGIYLPGRSEDASSIEGCIDHLRMQVKYLLFDLEATKRENRYLRQMLRGRPKDGGTSGRDTEGD